MNAIPLSVLDLVSLQQGESIEEAVTQSVELAQAAESLGYARIWYAEHHNSRALATAAPEIMIQHVAQQTRSIRVGAGGVMLPNHPPLKIAEVFRLLNAIYPDRIDLGLGRAPGTDQRTALALRRYPAALQADEYPERLAELLGYDGDPSDGIVAIPAGIGTPPMYLLGSSGFSAHLAAQVGLAFSFASHINRGAAVPAMRAYRQLFQPSARLKTPYGILACSVVIGDSMEHAQKMMKVAEIATWQLITGSQQPLPTLENALRNPLSEIQRLQISRLMSNAFVGDAGTVALDIRAFADETQADEVMLTVRVPGHDARVSALSGFRAAWDSLP